MEQSPIRTIIFDLGGVFVSSGYIPNFIHEVSEYLGVQPATLRNAMGNYEAYEIGKISAYGFWTDVAWKLGILGDAHFFMEKWLEHYRKTEINEQMIRFAHNLRTSGYKVTALSNSQEPDISYDRERGLYTFFDAMTLSSEVGSRKPEWTIYRKHLRKVGVKPEETIFIDDKEEFLEEPEKHGMRTIQYTDPDSCKRALREIGVLWQEELPEPNREMLGETGFRVGKERL